MEIDIEKLNEEIPEYTIESFLGSGGFGETYLATHDLLGKHVAIKIFPKDLFENPDYKNSFLAYIANHTNLTNSNVVKVLGVNNTRSGLAYVVMNYIPGSSLKECINEGSIDHSNILPVIYSIASIICDSHDSVFFQHTVKPENILIDSEGLIYLSDIGISSCLPQEVQIKYLGLSSYKYQSPEHAEDNVRDARSDVYSLSALLYEVIEGSLPKGVIKGTPNAQDPLFKLKTFLIKCLDPDKTVRVATMDEFLEQLYEIQENTGTKLITNTDRDNLETILRVNGSSENQETTQASPPPSDSQPSKKESKKSKEKTKLTSTNNFSSNLPYVILIILLLIALNYITNRIVESRRNKITEQAKAKESKLINKEKNQTTNTSEKSDSLAMTTQKSNANSSEQVTNKVALQQKQEKIEKSGHLDKPGDTSTTDTNTPKKSDLLPVVTLTSNTNTPTKEIGTVTLDQEQDGEKKSEELNNAYDGPTPDPNAIDLIIRKGWINRTSNKALILLNFGTAPEEEGNNDENAQKPEEENHDGNPQKPEESVDENNDMFFESSSSPIVFQCAYSINDKWDTLKPGGDANPNPELKIDEDVAAGGFNTRWCGIINPSDSILKEGVQMRHVFQIDLSNEQIAGKAKFILIKVNYGYSKTESNYKNNVIALPLDPEGIWTEVIHK